MTIQVEDGTGLADAEAFCSVAFADTYLATRGYTLWATMSEAEREQALRRSADYMEQLYRERWAGYRINTTQSLSWPRYEVPMKDAAGGYMLAYYESDEVPLIVQQANALLAYKAAGGDLSPDIGRLKQRVKVGPIETEYAVGGTPYTRHRAIDNMLLPFFKGASGLGSIPVVRC